MLLASKDREAIEGLKRLLSTEFEMKNLGKAQKILGMEVKRNRKQGNLFLSQAGYVKKVLEKFNMAEAKTVQTPLAAHFRVSSSQAPKTEQERSYMYKVSYSNATGSLMYAMICTRPDIAHAASLVSRFMASPGQEHWSAVKWLFRYLRGTQGIGLVYTEEGKVETDVSSYVDADYAGDLNKHRSLTSYVFMVVRKLTYRP